VPFTTDALVWRDVQLTSAQQQQVRGAVEQDLQDPLLNECLPADINDRRSVVEALHRDSLLAGELGMPFAAEPAIERFSSFSEP
jgi:hypothetical protein